MAHDLKLGLHLKRGSIQISNADELTHDGCAILDMAKSGNDDSFQKCCEILEKNLSMMYIISSVD